MKQRKKTTKDLRTEERREVFNTHLFIDYVNTEGREVKVYMVEIIDQEEARILIQWHVLYKAYVEEEAKLKVGAAANQQEKQTKRKKLVWKFLLHLSGSTMYVASIISVDLATSTNMRHV
ncbi:unnamed protein product [Brassica napus]|uniref:(rape) hypothetical protein n=1 Tax=Brassica napus TaxID=3708 RepID=A0A816RBH2_BRANA|nr:unnamed protein product [Brassica napus]